jgi:hypothetical protein
VSPAVSEAVPRAVSAAVQDAVTAAVSVAMQDAVRKAVTGGVAPGVACLGLAGATTAGETDGYRDGCCGRRDRWPRTDVFAGAACTS